MAKTLKGCKKPYNLFANNIVIMVINGFRKNIILAKERFAFL